MNILQIGTTDIVGGAASISWTIKQELEKEGHIMPMFVADKKSNARDVFSIRRTFHKYFQMILSNDIDFSDTDWILDTKEFKDADIVHLHNLHGWYFNLMTLKKMSKIKPIVWTLHDMWAITPHCAHSYSCELKNGFYQCPSLESYPRITWHNERYLSKRKQSVYENAAIEIVTPSRWLKDKVQISVLKNKNIHHISNGIDLTIFNSSNKHDAREALGIPQGKKVLLFVSDGGKHNPYKGWEYTEKILQNNTSAKDLHFICIGGKEGELSQEQNNITYIPYIKDQNLLASYYTAADIFLYPSLADSFGLVVAEAMACGTPVLTFETGGIPEIIEHKVHGYVAKYEDSEDIIRGLEYLLQLPENEIITMSQQCAQKIRKNFSKEIMVARYTELYSSLIK